MPGDKSVSHRSVLLGSLARGRTTVRGLLRGDDVLALVGAFQSCGVAIDLDSEVVEIIGRGLHGLSPPKAPIDCGNSGTAMRLLAGVFSGQRFTVELFGDASLSKRPMSRVAAPLAEMGARVGISDDGTPPLRIEPVDRLQPAHWQMSIASAQVKSTILLAGLYASGTSGVHEPNITRDHTERMLELFGAPVRKRGNWIFVDGGDHLRGADIEVPGDISSAAFFIAGALLDSQSDLAIESVGVNPTRTGLIEALRSMGGVIEIRNHRMAGNEPIADLRIRGCGKLCGINVPAGLIPAMIDEIPILAVVSAFASGVTRITGCEELRVKESDRISTTVDGLRRLGVTVEEKPDGMVIQGGVVGGGAVDSCGDHRIAMAFSIAGTRALDDVIVRDCECVSTSFPGFADLARQAGMDIRQNSEGDC